MSAKEVLRRLRDYVAHRCVGRRLRRAARNTPYLPTGTGMAVTI